MNIRGGIKQTGIIVSLALILISAGCEKAQTLTSRANETPEERVKTIVEEPEIPNFVDVPEMANRTAAEFDAQFGTSLKITPIKDRPALMPGEYRLYAVAGHPKGLSVRFFRNRAKRFNLLLGTPMNSSADALAKVFKINVASSAPENTAEPLSEKWKGRFNGIEFETVYAKRGVVNGDFTMVHAEVAGD